MSELLALAMVFALCLLTLLGFPIAFTLGGTALLFAGLGWLIGVFDPSFLGFVPSRIYGVMSNPVLLAIPLFIFMGVMLERTRVAEDLLEAMGRTLDRLHGGLGMAVSIVGALLAASTGIVGATVVTMGLISLPTMLRRGYDPALACGSIAAAGTLGQIIPPSIVLIILGDQISNAYQQVQRQLGNFAPEPVSVGELFAGALIPGLLLVGLYIFYQIGRAWLNPASSPALPAVSRSNTQPARLLHALVAPVVLICAVLGSILAGIATPTEAAAIGAVGATLLGALRQRSSKPWPLITALTSIPVLLALGAVFDLRLTRAQISLSDGFGLGLAGLCCGGLIWGLGIALWRAAQQKLLQHVAIQTTRFSAMIFAIVIGAGLFSVVFRGFGGDDLVQALLSELPGGAISALWLIMALMFLLGFILDVIEITYVVVPVVAPVLLQMGFDPIWLGVMFALNLQTSFLTPPLGYALFYLRSVVPAEIATGQIYRGVIPFVLLQLISLLVLALFPRLSTWLPELIFG